MPEHDIPVPPVDLPDPDHGPTITIEGGLHPSDPRAFGAIANAVTTTVGAPIQARIEERGRKVEVGVATWAGYAGGGASALSPFVAYLAGLPLPEGTTAVLVGIGGVLTAITTIGRMLQAR